jgi:hypothetical protein
VCVVKKTVSTIVWIALLSVHSAVATEDVAPRVPLPPGETPLADIGAYRVSWQSYGKPPVAMPYAWRGESDPESGIVYRDCGLVFGRQSLGMHAPWRVPPGRMWVDYDLALPKAGPTRLSFGVALGPDLAAAPKSDGVTFSCYLIEGDEQRELMRQHHTTSEWREFTFDLSSYAGKLVVLRLQVEPGPKNDTSFDFCLFGNARLFVGDPKDSQNGAAQSRSRLLREMVSSRAYQATAACGLQPLCNNPQNGVAPSNLLPCKNRLEPSDKSWKFIYEGDDCRVVYTYSPTDGTLNDFRVQIDEGRPFSPAAEGGITVALQHADKTEERPARGGKAVKVAPEGDTLNVIWQYDIEGRPLQVAWRYRILGKALLVSARCDEPRVSRFSLGDVGLAPLRKVMGVPYLLGGVSFLRGPNVFVGRYLDWTVSHASQCPHGSAMYEPKTDGVRNPLVESGYVAVSPDVGEVLPNIPHPPSPYLAVLGPRIMLDVWGHHKGSYAGDAENLRTLKDNGVDHLAIISHDWQRWGYDVKLPDHIPANPAFGGDAGMITFGKAANECGYLWSLHENYIDLYPDAPSYDASARVLLADGTPSKAWYNEGTKVQSFGLKCNRALDFARQNAPEIHHRYGTTAAYLDVHSCVPPWHQLDHQADQPMAAQALAKMKCDTELFQFMRDTHQGPLFGEGYLHFYWAGRCDGVEAQVVGGEDHAPLLDFDLLKLHPQMVNHGMGYYERWYRGGYQLRYGVDAGSMEQIDKYRAQELAYGHAGFLGAIHTSNLACVAREHHLMHPVQKLYGTAKPNEIRYEVEGQMVTASVALAAGDSSRQRVRYQSGLTLWVNWRGEPWLVEGRILPQWGFLALGSDTDVSTALHDGKLADYVECPEYVFADARTEFEADYLRNKKDIEPRLLSFKYLGDNRVEATYEWIVNEAEPMADDLTCFVHGLCTGPDTSETIAFQQDHPPPKPTSQWRQGDRIVDGPYAFEVSDKADTYEFVIGLYRGSRAVLRTPDGFETRVPLARLNLQRKDGKITNITAEKFVSPASHKVQEADFTTHLNPPGTWVEFPAVRTDGAVKINREQDRLVVFPLPRDKAFRASLNLKTLAPLTDPMRAKVHALAAGTCQDMGEVECTVENGWLMFLLGKPGVGRYVITWK